MYLYSYKSHRGGGWLLKLFFSGFEPFPKFICYMLYDMLNLLGQDSRKRIMLGGVQGQGTLHCLVNVYNF